MKGLIDESKIIDTTNKIADIVNIVIDQIKNIIDNIDKKEARGCFTQNLAKNLYKESNCSCALVCSNAIKSTGHYHHEIVKYDRWEYNIYLYPKGSKSNFINQGDGGYINWAFYGDFERDGNYVKVNG